MRSNHAYRQKLTLSSRESERGFLLWCLEIPPCPNQEIYAVSPYNPIYEQRTPVRQRLDKPRKRADIGNRISTFAWPD
jgi:hypothetical protein